MIDFHKYTDYIYCLNYLPNGRTSVISKKFNDIGINTNDSSFFYFNNDIEHIIGKNEFESFANNSIVKYWLNLQTELDNNFEEAFRYAFIVGYNTYRVLKIAQYMGYERIMIFEDDIIFHKDHEFIKSNLDIINSTNFDYCLCNTLFTDKIYGNKLFSSYGGNKNELLKYSCTAESDNVFRINDNTGLRVSGGAWIILTKTGINKIINLFEENNFVICLDSLPYKNEIFNFDVLFTPEPLGLQEMHLQNKIHSIWSWNENVNFDNYIC